MTSIDQKMPEEDRQDSDYDGAWKELLRSHLSEAIHDCFPALFQRIDWSFEPEWLDKEISQIVGQSGHRNREVDVLFKVRLLNGKDQWILCHLEIQTSYEAGFSFRIDLYHSGLKWMFREEVVTLVILADLNPHWRPSEHHFEFGDFRSSRHFPICKVLDRLATDWRESSSLVAQVARAQIAALETASDPEARFSAKTQLVRNLYTQGFSSDRIRETFRLLDWMMRLRADLESKFRAELVAYEEELSMPYVTSIERLAKEEGLELGHKLGLELGQKQGLEQGHQQGRKQGSDSLLLRILTRRCGLLPDDLQDAVRQLTLEQCHDLGEALLGFESLQDLRNWIQAFGH